MAAESALDVALFVASTFEQLGIEYVVGGSFASSVHGEPRSTQDVDFVADLQQARVGEWIELLESEFYVDADRVSQAVRSRRSFNIIHLRSSFKAGIFVKTTSLADKLQLSRRELYEFPDGRSLWITSAEDIVLQKLLRYRLGDEVSDRQWRDVLAILKVSKGKLDLDGLAASANALSIEDLLARALQESEKA